MDDKKITTKAAKCNKCGKYHLIASIELFESDQSTRKDFAHMAAAGFQIIDVTTRDARDNFGGCPRLIQQSLF